MEILLQAKIISRPCFVLYKTKGRVATRPYKITSRFRSYPELKLLIHISAMSNFDNMNA